MTSAKKLAVGLMVLAALTLMGCGTTTKKDKEGEKNSQKSRLKVAHPTEGPHGGAFAEWGEEEYHAEFKVDHKTKTVTVYILGPDAKTPKAIKADVVKLSIKKPALQLDLKPKEKTGEASEFSGTHDAFAKEQEFAGTLSAKVGDKQYAGDFEEKPHKHPKK